MNTKELKILFLLATVNFTHILDFMVIMPLGNLIMPYFNVGTQAFSIMVSAYAFSAGFSSFFSAFLVNGYDRKKVLLLAYCGFIIGTLGCAVAPSFAFLMVSRIIAGLFGGMLGAQVISIVSDTVVFERRGQAMGIVMSAFSMASIAGVPLSLILANKFSWHVPFYLVVLLAVISFILLYINLPSLTGHIEKAKLIDNRSIISSVLMDKTQRGALLFSGLMMLGHFLIIPFINPFLEFNNGFPKSFAPYVYLMGGMASLFAANFLGKLSDKYGKWLVFRYSVVASFPLIIFVTTLPTKNSILVLIIFALWFAASTGRGVTSQALVSNVVKPELRGSFQSFNSFMQQVGTGIAGILGGLVVSSGLDFKLQNYFVLGILSVFILALTILIGRPIFVGEKSESDGQNS